MVIDSLLANQSSQDVLRGAVHVGSVVDGRVTVDCNISEDSNTLNNVKDHRDYSGGS
ncbi:hypothetical protein D3C86_2186120 [compost metagenome]